ncbi:hypothetical protein L873DRAFT_1774663 [Choiromyces venosus 120613-1]|uniref:DNA replication regulator Sld3 C-terminal domain-containing protein n=1 Tax=Choiromyces venosus 120613-1 TaxID=1336337 RepID=A0A3N4JDF7_9PEZI|nr:hypothetical protein L873DRAFT_1774663 [Choiromyces venosus 120613-1]
MDKEHDHLRHFCVEVVLALYKHHIFRVGNDKLTVESYASKLPEECKSINKKCGGRSGSSTARGSKDASNSNKDKRKLTKKAPGFARSITAPAATNATREASVDTLAALVAADAASVSKTTIRGGTLNSKSFVKRQVQISSKVVQKKKVDEELKDAINALKKPNRIAVATDIVEDAKKRLTTSSNRRPRKVPGNPLANIQVMATPKRRRTIKPQQKLPPLFEDESDAAPQDDFPPQVTNPKMQFEVASTPVRPLQKQRMMEEDLIPSTSPFEVPEESALRPSLNFAKNMFVTPKKKPRSMGTDLGAGNSIVLATPKNNSGLSRSLSCSVLDSKSLQTPGSSPDGGVKLFGSISETPVKRTLPVGPSGGNKEISIYDSLGWNDDYEL